VKRSYKLVTVEPAEGGFRVLLDGRPTRTPAKQTLVLPALALAEAIAEEWRGQGETVRPLSMGLTRLANTGLDRIRARRAQAVEEVARYGGTELMCYRAEAPPELVARQHARWQPWLDWAAAEFGAPLAVGTGIVHVAQEPAALAALRLAVARAGDLELAALGAMVQALGSLVLGLAVWRGALGPDQAVDLSQLDEAFQVERWGEDAEAASRLAALRRDIGDAARFLSLLRGG
jgi:chaperone required for assembly of F1-ATPase